VPTKSPEWPGSSRSDWSRRLALKFNPRTPMKRPMAHELDE